MFQECQVRLVKVANWGKLVSPIIFRNLSFFFFFKSCMQLHRDTELGFLNHFILHILSYLPIAFFALY